MPLTPYLFKAKETSKAASSTQVPCNCHVNNAQWAVVVGNHVISGVIFFMAEQVKKKMSAEDFLKNNRGINDGQDLPADFMRSLYARIVNNEIKVGCRVSWPGDEVDL